VFRIPDGRLVISTENNIHRSEWKPTRLTRDEAVRLRDAIDAYLAGD
jgi:hypothetical protein